MLSLKSCGVSKVYVIDVVKNRLNKALEIGATGVIDASKENVVERTLELTDGKGSDLTIETSGMQIAMNQSINFAKMGSTIVFVGYPESGNADINISIALNKELTFKTVFRYRHIYPLCISAVQHGSINIKSIVTNIFDFNDIQNAMDESLKDKSNIVKSIIKI